ncbi:dTDP-4-dehydrorhamnose reductase [Desulfatirhabdium butyrativorans]|uniref:dTDP-4-dehydrorhamnose reductase n=1 Tax=Desulfatirhabdium butyrativorans TaxID=340467 RepID=UPI00041C3DDB|nr:dTDP-4-dehydrorhamnose reductase [Desulfatirhabdium butyrativorans]
MKILVTGSRGQLGTEILRQAQDMKFSYRGVDLPEWDITVRDQVEEVVAGYRPDVVINAAAYTQVDKAETEPETARAVNADAALYVAEACARHGVPLIHISTDFVFDGAKTVPYIEDDPIGPLSVYGSSKAAGESHVRNRLDRHLIVRTSWLYGVYGNNFVKTMLRLASERETLRVVDDQLGCPTCAADLAAALLALCKAAVADSDVAWGTYHYCGEGVTSWYGLAKEAIQMAASRISLRMKTIEPIPTEQYPTPAKRPAYSALNCEKIRNAFGIRPRPWRESLRETVDGILQGASVSDLGAK